MSWNIRNGEPRQRRHELREPEVCAAQEKGEETETVASLREEWRAVWARVSEALRAFPDAWRAVMNALEPEGASAVTLVDDAKYTLSASRFAREMLGFTPDAKQTLAGCTFETRGAKLHAAVGEVNGDGGESGA